jgi:hypothetical protein
LFRRKVIDIFCTGSCQISDVLWIESVGRSIPHRKHITGFWLYLQVEPTQVGLIYRGSELYLLGPPKLVSSEDGDSIQSPKLGVLIKRHHDG